MDITCQADGNPAMPRNQTGMGHHATANLQASVDSGRGDVPLKDLKFRCTKCDSRRTNAVVMARSAMGVQPWRSAPE